MHMKQQARIALAVGLGVLVLGLPAMLTGCGKKSKTVYIRETERRPTRVNRRDVRRRPPVYYQEPRRRPVPHHDDRYRDRDDNRGDRDHRGDRDRRHDRDDNQDRGRQRYDKRGRG